MIAKQVPMRSIGKSDFSSLASYITDAQSKDHRLGHVSITNCDSGSLAAAIEEVLATQHLNIRAKSDKTYHLIVSFRAGENPDAEILKAIEEKICQGLGYGEHQRISAVHTDTDNLHIHIAINKIHPTRNTIHEPYYSHRALSDLCETLEAEYGLEPDNHMPHQRGAAARAADMERHSGIESLVGWIKRECLGEIKSAGTWEELHDVLQQNGLEMRRRGNGLVVVADDGTTVKASTLARELSKPALEKRLGSFVEPAGQKAKTVKRSYKKAPVRSRINTTELYAKYKSEQQKLTASRADALAQAKRRKDRAVETAKAANKLRRATIKALRGKGVNKKLLYMQASASLKGNLDSIHKDYAKDRERLYNGFQRRTWADWLKEQAGKGNGEALAALRARGAAQGLQGNTLASKGRAKPGNAPVIDNITKKGTVIYRVGKNAVRDDGDRLQVSRDATRETVLAALRLAVERYGKHISVNGPPEFKALVVRSAVDGKLAVTFADPALEKRREALLQDNFSVSAKRPIVAKVGKIPPPIAHGYLRTLSDLGVMKIEGPTAISPQPIVTRMISDSEPLKSRLQAKWNARKEQSQRRKGRGR